MRNSGRVNPSRFSKDANPVNVAHVQHAQDYLDMDFTIPEPPAKDPGHTKLGKRALCEMMTNSVEAGLDKAIPPDNKGFKLLQKIGFSGGVLGKNGNGIAEPLKIVKREDIRGGLGIEEMVARKKNEKKILSQDRRDNEVKLKQSFVNVLADNQKAKRMKSHLISSGKIIEELDSNAGIEKHYLWPERVDDFEDGEHNPEDLGQPESTTSPMEKLHLCLSYLRDTYHYCLFCGCKFEDRADLDTNCPGCEYDDH